MGRPKKYTGGALRKAVDGYFRSISRTRTITEEIPTGRVDKYGHPEVELEAVTGDDGQPLTERQWVRPPSIGGLCRALGVHRSMWSEWHDKETYPEFTDTVEYADDTIQSYLEDELLTREGKNTRGVEFLLSARYDLKEQKHVEITATGARLGELPDEDLWRIAQYESKGDTT